MTGYTGPDDGKPLSPEFRKLFPPGTPGVGAGKPGAQQQQPRTLVHNAPKTPGGKRPSARVVKPPKPAKRTKPRKSTPGGQAQPSRSKPQQGK